MRRQPPPAIVVAHQSEDDPVAQPKPNEQMMLIDLPAMPVAAPGTVIAPSKRRAAPAVARPTPSDPFAPVPDTVPGIMLVDPRFVRVDPINARYGIPFDSGAQAELIESMAVAGNTVPVRLRRDPAGGYDLLCPSGSQRLGAALQLQRDQPGFRLRDHLRCDGRSRGVPAR